MRNQRGNIALFIVVGVVVVGVGIGGWYFIQKQVVEQPNEIQQDEVIEEEKINTIPQKDISDAERIEIEKVFISEIPKMTSSERKILYQDDLRIKALDVQRKNSIIIEDNIGRWKGGWLGHGTQGGSLVAPSFTKIAYMDEADDMWVSDASGNKYLLVNKLNFWKEHFKNVQEQYYDLGIFMTEFSPDGNKLMLYIQLEKQAGEGSPNTVTGRFYIADFIEGKLYHLNGFEEFTPYQWLDNNSIIVEATTREGGFKRFYYEYDYLKSEIIKETRLYRENASSSLGQITSNDIGMVTYSGYYYSTDNVSRIYFYDGNETEIINEAKFAENQRPLISTNGSYIIFIKHRCVDRWKTNEDNQYILYNTTTDEERNLFIKGGVSGWWSDAELIISNKYLYNVTEDKFTILHPDGDLQKEKVISTAGPFEKQIVESDIWDKYKNAKYGVEISYPRYWEIKEKDWELSLVTQNKTIEAETEISLRWGEEDYGASMYEIRSESCEQPQSINNRDFCYEDYSYEGSLRNITYSTSENHYQYNLKLSVAACGERSISKLDLEKEIEILNRMASGMQFSTPQEIPLFIEVITPNGGEVFTVGEKIAIQWEGNTNDVQPGFVMYDAANKEILGRPVIEYTSGKNEIIWEAGIYKHYKYEQLETLKSGKYKVGLLAYGGSHGKDIIFFDASDDFFELKYVPKKVTLSDENGIPKIILVEGEEENTILAIHFLEGDGTIKKIVNLLEPIANARWSEVITIKSNQYIAVNNIYKSNRPPEASEGGEIVVFNDLGERLWSTNHYLATPTLSPKGNYVVGTTKRFFEETSTFSGPIVLINRDGVIKQIGKDSEIWKIDFSSDGSYFAVTFQRKLDTGKLYQADLVVMNENGNELWRKENLTQWYPSYNVPVEISGDDIITVTTGLDEYKVYRFDKQGNSLP